MSIFYRFIFKKIENKRRNDFRKKYGAVRHRTSCKGNIKMRKLFLRITEKSCRIECGGIQYLHFLSLKTRVFSSKKYFGS